MFAFVFTQKDSSSHEDLKSEWRLTVRLLGAVGKVFCCGLECHLHPVLDEYPGWNWLIPSIFTFLICKMRLINGLNPIGLWRLNASLPAKGLIVLGTLEVIDKCQLLFSERRQNSFWERQGMIKVYEQVVSHRLSSPLGSHNNQHNSWLNWSMTL